MHIAFISIPLCAGWFSHDLQREISVGKPSFQTLQVFLQLALLHSLQRSRDFNRIQNERIQYLQLTKEVTEFWGSMHFGFAFALFACFIIFCLYFFQKPDADYEGAALAKFKRRKLIYTFCGWAIIISIIMIGLFNFVFKVEKGFFSYSTFIFETTALWAFGAAWLVKGSAVLKNLPVVKNMVRKLR